MPPANKSNLRHSPTPSIQPGELLNALLIIKDTVNTTLLRKHTHLGDLANILFEVEDQIRDAIEQTLKNLKAEIEKRKRKLAPGIKKLQETLKSLAKSEAKIKGSEKGGKNADVKKAKLRIREAQKTMKELGTNEGEYGVSAYIADQITILCQRLILVPPKLKTYETTKDTLNAHKGDKSDSDSDEGRKSRTETPSHIYAEIDPIPMEDTYLTPRRRNASHEPKVNDLKHYTHENDVPLLFRNMPQSPRLQNVHLFSSDSDSLEDEFKKGKNLSPGLNEPRSRNPLVQDVIYRESRGRTKRYQNVKVSRQQSRSPNSPNKDYESLDRLSRRSPEANRQRSQSNPPCVGELRKHTFGEHSLQASKIHESKRLKAPIDDYMKRMSPSVDSYNQQLFIDYNLTPEPHFPKTESKVKPTSPKSISNNVSKQSNITSPHRVKDGREQKPTSPQSARSTPKRYLPSIPKIPHDVTDALNTDAIRENNIEHHLFGHNGATDEIDSASKIPINENTIETSSSSKSDTANDLDSKLDPEYVDIEELKFRESVRSARREIIDKLKNRYHHSENVKSEDIPCYSDFKRKINVHSSTGLDTETNGYISGHDTNVKCTYKDSVRRRSIDLVNAPRPSELRNINGSFSPLTMPSSSGIYRGTLVKVTPENDSAHFGSLRSVSSNTDSIVTSYIKKFESEILKNDISEFKADKPLSSTRRYGNGRIRSSSEPRTTFVPSKQTNIRKGRPDHILTQPKALRPRRDSGISTISGSDREHDEHSISTNDQSLLKKSCTENDLRNLMNESPSSIRRRWSMRRSSSVNAKVQNRNKPQGPRFVNGGSFLLPSHFIRCHASAMVVMNNGSVIVLDERNFYLHLFDKHFNHVYALRLYDIPRGCERVNEDYIVVGIPYKKILHYYCISCRGIRLAKAIDIPCDSWILDIAFAQKHVHVLCKSGHVHIMQEDGKELSACTVGMNGKIFVHPGGKRFFVLGEGKLSKFDMGGKLISSEIDIDSRSMLFLENRVYVADRQRHRVVPLSDAIGIQDLTKDKLEYPSAICTSINSDIMLVSQYEECLDDVTTRTINVYKLNKAYV